MRSARAGAGRFFLRLLADIGGTHARFALAQPGGGYERLRILPCVQHASLEQAVHGYLESVGAPRLHDAAIAIAAPIHGDAVRMTNHPWAFSIDGLRASLGLHALRVVNDLAAVAMAVPTFTSQDIDSVGKGEARPFEPACVVAPGTGLGVAGLFHAPDGWKVIASEGGHVAFSPADPAEAEILRFAWREHSRVSAEHLLSGPGIALIHRALQAAHGSVTESIDTSEIVRRARDGECPLCVEALSQFSAMLGTFAANVAVTFGARGGVYIAGGVVGKLGDQFDRARFRGRFESQGGSESHVARIPTWLIRREFPALDGLAAMPF